MNMLQGIGATGALATLVPADVLPPNPAVSQVEKPEINTAEAASVATATQSPAVKDPNLGVIIDQAA